VPTSKGETSIPEGGSSTTRKSAFNPLPGPFGLFPPDHKYLNFLSMVGSPRYDPRKPSGFARATPTYGSPGNLFGGFGGTPNIDFTGVDIDVDEKTGNIVLTIPAEVVTKIMEAFIDDAASALSKAISEAAPKVQEGRSATRKPASIVKRQTRSAKS